MERISEAEYYETRGDNGLANNVSLFGNTVWIFGMFVWILTGIIERELSLLGGLCIAFGYIIGNQARILRKLERVEYITDNFN